MQVSDLVNHYQNTSGAGTKIQTKTKGVEQLVKTVSSMEKGQVFEGTVKSVKGDKVVLSLSNGQNITAKVDKGVSLSQGQSVFFQVKSNEGATVNIRPVTSQIGGNLTLLNALNSAGLPQNEKNLNMVNSMMKEQMPIDKDSIQDMIRTVRKFPDADIDTIVSMKKMDLPITEGMITQYENYRESEGAVLKMVGQLSDGIPEMLSGEGVTKEDALTFTKELLEIVSPEGEEVTKAVKAEGSVALKGMVTEGLGANPLNPDGSPAVSAGITIDPATGQPVMANETVEGKAYYGSAAPTDGLPQAPGGDDLYNLPGDSIARTISPEAKSEVTAHLKSLPGFVEQNPQLFDVQGNIPPETKSSEILRAVTNHFASNPSLTKDNLLSTMENPGIKDLTRGVMEHAWTIEPRELTKKNAIDKLYEKIEEDMEKIVNSSKNVSKVEHNPVAQAAQSVKDNLSFIKEVNQLYNYIQIPLQMSGEKTTGDLFVYQNKKRQKSENEELTAFLHFDMENLGSTDISVKMQGKKVDTRFFMEDDISFQIVENNLHILEERLKELGFNATLTVENDTKKMNFVEDFLKQDAKTAGDIHRYSFDVRA